MALVSDALFVRFEQRVQILAGGELLWKPTWPALGAITVQATPTNCSVEVRSKNETSFRYLDDVPIVRYRLAPGAYTVRATLRASGRTQKPLFGTSRGDGWPLLSSANCTINNGNRWLRDLKLRALPPGWPSWLCFEPRTSMKFQSQLGKSPDLLSGKRCANMCILSASSQKMSLCYTLRANYIWRLVRAIYQTLARTRFWNSYAVAWRDCAPRFLVL